MVGGAEAVPKKVTTEAYCHSIFAAVPDQMIV